MKKITVLLLLFFVSVSMYAQETVIELKPEMFDKVEDQFFPTASEGWLFKRGSDTIWARKNLDISNWKKMKPSEISSALTDDSGRFEGWFRIKIKPDSTLTNFPLGIKLSTWAASDLYINGKLVLCAGNTGSNGKPYKEFNPYLNPSYTFPFEAGKTYTIALHVVDYESPLEDAMRLESDGDGTSLLRITGVNYNAINLANARFPIAFSMLWMIVPAVLSLLFWMLFLQNRQEKNLRLIAIGTTFNTLYSLFSYTSWGVKGTSYYLSFLFQPILNLMFGGLAIVTMVLILVRIFERRVTNGLKIYLVIIFMATWIPLIFIRTIDGRIVSLAFLSVVIVCVYYLVTSWKNLRGAQWAVVVGLIISFISVALFALLPVFYSNLGFMNFYACLTGYLLSFPLSLLAYVSIRFRKMIEDVRQNAQQIVQLSEEKATQAQNQQKLLEVEVARQTAELRNTLSDLKATQSQLIQSEKMASLGELTAGIAHEIQNPLNFVNNFSDVSIELLDEMDAEIDQGDLEEAKAISSDIKQNLEKINHHGKRADAIVKGMLQHSRNSSGKKEPTDINALANEYLRLSYHGLRAKDKSFNATLTTDFDESIGKIDIIPQDFGRVILNLLTNSFYAVNEKKQLNPENYEPTVSISTKKVGDKVEISVGDNGNGIPQTIADKIFQPFFTTKPTGQGTGLGLSLSYDIVVKGHGGTLTIESKENEFTVFTIQLPTNII